jgi:hypothetical protein
MTLTAMGLLLGAMILAVCLCNKLGGGDRLLAVTRRPI